MLSLLVNAILVSMVILAGIAAIMAVKLVININKVRSIAREELEAHNNKIADMKVGYKEMIQEREVWHQKFLAEHPVKW